MNPRRSLSCGSFNKVFIGPIILDFSFFNIFLIIRIKTALLITQHLLHITVKHKYLKGYQYAFVLLINKFIVTYMRNGSIKPITYTKYILWCYNTR